MRQPHTGPPTSREPARWRLRLLRPRIGPLLHWWSVAGFEWNTLELAIGELPPGLEGVRLLHVTDLHLRSRWTDGLDELVEGVKRHQPEVVLFGGDLAQDLHHVGPALPHIERVVSEVRGSVATLGVLGNHDSDLLGGYLERWGVKLIMRERVELTIGGSSIEVIGFPGPERADVEGGWTEQFPPPRAGVPRIILSHYPDLIGYASSLRADLFLAGHTHGGQICLPGGHPILRHDSLPRRFCHGAHRFGDTCLCVNRGLGFSSPLQVRAWSPGEVITVRLARAAADAT